MNNNTDSIEIDPQVLYFIASEDDIVWKYLIGQNVCHFIYGSGKVLDVVYSQSESPSLKIQFYEDPTEREFISEAFSDGKFTIAFIGAEFASDIQNKQVEAERRIELDRLEKEAIDNFNRLKSKYLISWYVQDQPISRLNKILLQLDNGEVFSKSDIGWLISQNLHPPIAIFYEERFNKSNDLWNCVLASSHWRKADHPERSIKITEGISSADKRLMSAILTTRGGAFKDLNKLDRGEEHAQKAIELTPRSYYPYNLMGSIKYQLGDGDSGDNYFSIALELGSPIAEQDVAIYSAVKAANPQEQYMVAQYLLSKDSTKYKWANKYVKSDALKS